MKTDYYELLEVSSSADDAQLRKAYRRKALQYHPDKNPDTIEEATAIFAEIRSAYEVLSDPQERAWYDAHKEQILSDKPLYDDDGYTTTEVDATITGVTTEELLMFFNSSLYTRIDDSPAGMYQIISKLFSRLATDEVLAGRRQGLDPFSKYQDDDFESDMKEHGFTKACDLYESKYQVRNDLLLFPVFGYSRTEYSYLKDFYKKWNSFTTLKSFSWKDEYMYSKSYDRRTKREINKRNEKIRQQARNEYIKTVKRFVQFVKKLDQRLKQGLQKAEEAKKLKEQEKRGKKEKVATRSEFEAQSWQTVEEPDWEQLESIYEQASRAPDNSGETLENDEIILYDCFVCNKTFKSEKQLENHTQTKIHKKNIAEIEREMKKDSLTLGLDDLSELENFSSAHEYESTSDDSIVDVAQEIEELERQLADMDVDMHSDVVVVVEDDTESDVKSKEELTQLLESLNLEDKNGWEDSYKKSPAATNGRSSATEICATCSAAFSSRNKLFKHVQQTGHAVPPSKVKKRLKRAKRKGKK